MVALASVPVPVMVTVYEPAAVQPVQPPPPPPPPPLPPPQAGIRDKATITVAIVRKPSIFLRRERVEPKLTPISDKPKIGKPMA